MKRMGILCTLVVVGAAVGCVQVAIVTDRSTSRTQHQDVGRVSSSEQTADTRLDIPVSLVPK